MLSLRAIGFLALLLSTPILRSQPLYTGMGFELKRGENSTDYVISRVVPGSAAEEAGLHLGAQLLRFDAIDTYQFNAEGLADALNVPVGAKQEITWASPDGPKTINLSSTRTRGRALAGDCQDGEGLLLGSDGGEYRGRFVKGLLEGFGRVDFSDDDWYEGEFKQGRFSGRGIRRLHNKTFTGAWTDGHIEEGFGHLETEGAVLEGTGSWDEGFHGHGILTETAQHYIIEGTFNGAPSIWGVTGRARVKNPDTGHCFEGEFLKAEVKGEGRFETQGGQTCPLMPVSFVQLLKALAAPGGVAELAPKRAPVRDWGIEAETPETSQQAKPATTNRKTVATTPTLHECEACQGTGFAWERCGFCQGSGVIAHTYTLYHRTEGNSYQRSVYNTVGRLSGQETVRDVVTTTEQRAVESRCQACSGRGGHITTRRCSTCGGRGSTER